jgi:alpha-L-fucosidase
VNLLLNVGPQPDGCIPEVALERLAGIGEWMDVYGDSIYGTDATDIPKQSWGLTTQKDNKVYMHIIEDVTGCPVVEMPFDAKVKSVKVFKDGTPLKYTAKNGVLSVTLPETPSDIDYVITVELK